MAPMKSKDTQTTVNSRAVLSHAEILFGKNALQTITLIFLLQKTKAAPFHAGDDRFTRRSS